MNRMFLPMFLFLIQSCFAFESDYDKLMNPIKQTKLAEKKLGKSNPTLDGAIEPDFPDEKENNKTLDGVDSNKDGVRDDVEIWINRTAEDKYVRWALKDNYKRTIETYRAVISGQDEPLVHKSLAEYSNSSYCLLFMLKPYKENYINKFKKVPEEIYSTKLDNLILNTRDRNSAHSKWNKYQIKGSLGANSDEYCLKSQVGQNYKTILNNEIKKSSKK